ncbi:MAG: hypothetical protein ABJL67_03805 [Sulfitobacter sp.]
MTEQPAFVVYPNRFCAFEDIIDGYFPFASSLQQLMQRLGANDAVLELSHAPIMDLPDLPKDAPVPLRVTKGRVGIIDHMQLWVTCDAGELRISGTGLWHWFDCAVPNNGQSFDPNIRLAEPALVRGWADITDIERCSVMATSRCDARRFGLNEPIQPKQHEELLRLMGGRNFDSIGPIAYDGRISATDPILHPHEKPFPGDLLVWPRLTHSAMQTLDQID